MKRFTDTAKWSDPWFRRLPAPAKMLWFYILDHCDNVGIIEIDLELASIDCGIKITSKTMEEIGKRVESGVGGKYIVPKFVEFQIGKPSDSCAAHKKVIKAIKDNNLELDSLGYHYPKARLLDDYAKGNTTLKDKEEDKEEEEDKKKKGENRENKAKPDTRELLDEYFTEVGLQERDAEYAWNHWESKGWRNGRDSIKDWKATVRAWKAAGHWPSQKHPMPADGLPSKPKRKHPENWRQIATEIFGEPITCEYEDLTFDQKGDLLRHIRGMEDAA